MHSFTGHSAITEQSTALATLGKYKYLLSLVGASASLIELHSRPFTRVRKRFCKQNRTPPRRETRRIRLQSEGLRALRHLQEFFDSLRPEALRLPCLGLFCCAHFLCLHGTQVSVPAEGNAHQHPDHPQHRKEAGRTAALPHAEEASQETIFCFHSLF